MIYPSATNFQITIKIIWLAERTGGGEGVCGGDDEPPRDPHGAQTPGDEMAHHTIYTTLQIEFQQVI